MDFYHYHDVVVNGALLILLVISGIRWILYELRRP
jgi:hypothetical protein